MSYLIRWSFNKKDRVIWYLFNKKIQSKIMKSKYASPTVSCLIALTTPRASNSIIINWLKSHIFYPTKSFPGSRMANTWLLDLAAIKFPALSRITAPEPYFPSVWKIAVSILHFNKPDGGYIEHCQQLAYSAIVLKFPPLKKLHACTYKLKQHSPLCP